MTLQQLQAQALDIADKYTEKNKHDGHNQWDASAYMAGFVGDVGDLSKLVMAKANYRRIDNIDAKLAHELSDCLWSIFVLAGELNVDLEQAFTLTMEELENKLTAE